MFIKKLIIGLLSFYAVEVRRVSSKGETPSFLVKHERLHEAERRRETRKKKVRLYDKRKWKEKKQYKEKTFALKGKNPKDVRFSNQRKIRRMFRNS